MRNKDIYFSESDDSGTGLSRGDSLRANLELGLREHRVKIEVSGVQFLISEKKLDRWPRTLLGNQDDRLKYKDCIRNVFIFDSNASKTSSLFVTVSISEWCLNISKYRHPCYSHVAGKLTWKDRVVGKMSL